jgi:hypothetical protein
MLEGSTGAEVFSNSYARIPKYPHPKYYDLCAHVVTHSTDGPPCSGKHAYFFSSIFFSISHISIPSSQNRELVLTIPHMKGIL